MFSFEPYILLLWEKRWFLLANCIFAAVVAFAVAFFVVKREYASQVTFLPPTTGVSPILAASSGNPFLAGMLSGDDLNDNIEVIFAGKDWKRRVIDKFNLYSNYKLTENPNKFEEALRQMQKRVILIDRLKGKGIGMSRTVSYSVLCFHTSPDTALKMANFIFEYLDSAMIDISINRAKRNRVFIESQFNANRERLDSLQAAFREFQIAHKAFDIPEQMKMALKVYSDVKSALVMNDIRLIALQREFTGNSPEIIAVRNAQRAYNRKLVELEQNSEFAVLPSLNITSELTPAYVNIVRELEMQNQINLMLTKELEQARLQEARDISPLLVVDPAYKAEYKARPKRLQMMLAIVFGYMFFLITIITAYKLFTDYFRSFRTPKPES